MSGVRLSQGERAGASAALGSEREPRDARAYEPQGTPGREGGRERWMNEWMRTEVIYG